jgi:hypothetical protein
LRADIGLPPTSDSPPFEGQYSPSLVLAMFSKLLADKQPDWPRQAVITGFPFYDRDGEAGMLPKLSNFLNAGPPPLVFTLGSSAVVDAGQFYEHSIAAAKRLGRRAVKPYSVVSVSVISVFIGWCPQVTSTELRPVSLIRSIAR